jgi:short-subunit dehydrogenase
MSRQFTSTFAILAVLVSCLGHGATAFSLQMQAGKTAVIAGATGYIGKSTVRESVRQGYKTIALVRDKQKVESKEGKLLYGQFFEGAEIVECDVTNPEQLTKVSRKLCEDNVHDQKNLH